MPVNGKHLLHLVPHGINSNEFRVLESNNSLIQNNIATSKTNIKAAMPLCILRRDSKKLANGDMR